MPTSCGILVNNVDTMLGAIQNLQALASEQKGMLKTFAECNVGLRGEAASAICPVNQLSAAMPEVSPRPSVPSTDLGSGLCQGAADNRQISKASASPPSSACDFPVEEEENVVEVRVQATYIGSPVSVPEKVSIIRPLAGVPRHNQLKGPQVDHDTEFSSEVPESEIMSLFGYNGHEARSAANDSLRIVKHRETFVLRDEWCAELGEAFIDETCSRRKAKHMAHWRSDALETTDDDLQCWNRLVLAPGSQRRLLWDLSSMVVLGWDMLVVPFSLAFDPPESLILLLIAYMTMVYWLSDMAINFFTGYTEGKLTVLTPRKVVWHYLKTFFVLDAGILLIDFVLLFGQSRSVAALKIIRTMKFLKLLKSLKLIRSWKLNHLLTSLQNMLCQTETSAIWFGIIKLMIILLVLNHWVACSWYAIGRISCEHCPRPGFAEEHKLSNYSIAYRYVTCLHWALAQFTPAPNEIFPTNLLERLFATSVLVGAMVSYSAFVSTVTTGIMQLTNMSSGESRQFWVLKRYLRDWEVQSEFRAHIINYLKFACHQQRARLQDKDVKLLTLLSDDLRSELKQQTMKGFLDRHVLFLRLRQDARSPFDWGLESRYRARGDRIFQRGKFAEEMYFLGSGHLCYVIGDGFATSCSENSLEPHMRQLCHAGSTMLCIVGQWIGEPAMWTSQWVHFGDLHAHTESHVITIKSQPFNKMGKANVAIWTKTKNYAKLFLEALNDLDFLSDLTDDMLNPIKLLQEATSSPIRHSSQSGHS